VSRAQCSARLPRAHPTGHELNHVLPAAILPSPHGPVSHAPHNTEHRATFSQSISLSLPPGSLLIVGNRVLPLIAGASAIACAARISLWAGLGSGESRRVRFAPLHHGRSVDRALLNFSATNDEFGDHVRGGCAESLESSGGLRHAQQHARSHVPTREKISPFWRENVCGG
jgi:hypothetical protein